MPEDLPKTEQPPERKKVKPSHSSKMALLEVIERKKREDRVDYRTISQKHGVSCNSLRKLWVFFKRGQIDFGRPETLMEKEVDARVQHERKMNLLRRHLELLLNVYEGQIFKAGDAVVKKNAVQAYEKVGLQKILRELKTLSDLIGVTEKGYLAIIDEYNAAHAAQEKQATARPVMDVETKVSSATDEHRALQALGTMGGNGA
jgi:hypothetical protein